MGYELWVCSRCPHFGVAEIASLVAFFSVGAFNARPGNIDRKPQIAYLDEYCRSLKIRTLVYEYEYVDRHFSEDFGGYYVRCFDGYRKKCSRIHLFQGNFSEPEFAKILTGDVFRQTRDFSEQFKYCGFIVIKPLPETVVGRTTSPL